MLIVEKIHKIMEEAQTALELIQSGEVDKIRESIKHLDEVKDSNFAATHLAWIMVKDEE